MQRLGEYSDHGWPVVGACSVGAAAGHRHVARRPRGAGGRRPARLRPAAGRRVGRAGRRDADRVVVVPGHAGRHAARRAADRAEVVLHTDGAAVLAPPSETPTAGCHWRRLRPRSPATVRHRSVRSSRRSPPPSRCRRGPHPGRGRRALAARLSPRCRGSSGPRRGHRGAIGAAPEGHWVSSPRRPAPTLLGRGRGRWDTGPGQIHVGWPPARRALWSRADHTGHPPDPCAPRRASRRPSRPRRIAVEVGLGVGGGRPTRRATCAG